MAAIVWSTLNEEGDGLTEPAMAANAAASATISVDPTIHPGMSVDLIKNKIKEYNVEIHEIEEYKEGEY